MKLQIRVRVAPSSCSKHHTAHKQNVNHCIKIIARSSEAPSYPHHRQTATPQHGMVLEQAAEKNIQQQNKIILLHTIETCNTLLCLYLKMLYHFNIH